MYAADKPLPMKGSIACEVNIDRCAVQANLVIIKGKGTPFLGQETAIWYYGS